ncbi:MAG: peptidase C39 family protein [Methanosarcinaceae archaeon]|nr:peptidase C39 family protein [Methanosarcinaceae archaeon]
MKQKYHIRLASEHDLNSLFKLEEIAFETDRFSRDQIDYILTRSRATTFVLEDKSNILGAACVLWRKSHQGARLYNIAVDPALQGKGLGLRLLNECELEAACRGCKKITLEVRSDNEGGIRFYKKQNYTILRSMPDYYHDGTSGLKMSKTLDLNVPSEHKFNVPYCHQTLDFTCGPACLMMALKHFNPEIDLTRALEMTLWKEATLVFMASGFGGTEGYGLALSALNRGLSCRMVTSMDTVPMLKSVRIPEKREVMQIIHNDLKRKARRAGLGSAIYDYGMDELITAMHRDMLPIVLISTYRLTGDKVPHWVIVTGFDKDHFFIHDPDLQSYKKNYSKARNLCIEKSEFLRMTRYGKEVYRCLLLIGKDKIDGKR